MNEKKLKKIVDANFKANAELKVQYLFEDGYCYFIKGQAEQRKAETKKDYTTVHRDYDSEKKSEETAEKIAELESQILEKKQLLLDAKEDEKKDIEEQLALLELELEELNK